MSRHGLPPESHAGIFGTAGLPDVLSFEGVILQVLKIFRLARLVRVVRVIRSVPELMTLIKSVVMGVRSVFAIGLITMLFIYVIGVPQPDYNWIHEVKRKELNLDFEY